MNIEALYKEIAPRLTNWLVASGSSYHEACDLVQSTFLKIWKMRCDLHDNGADVSGLAFTIARNLRKNQVRDDARMTFVDEIKDEDAGTVDLQVFQRQMIGAASDAHRGGSGENEMLLIVSFLAEAEVRRRMQIRQVALIQTEKDLRLVIVLMDMGVVQTVVAPGAKVVGQMHGGP